jgi:DNA modification methylase
MKTNHTIYFKNAKLMDNISDQSISLVVTSPPYPMIEMWDQSFSQQNPKIGELLNNNSGIPAFKAMHSELSHIWKNIFRVLIPGGILCINIGDATRTIDKNFQLYPNHAQIINDCQNIGFISLPEIIWRKQTNAPNKFMGSGMLPGGAYVTLEHEYILIFRKGEKRSFDNENQKINRQESAYFWEERNKWFSDLWDIKGTQQILKEDSVRNRSAAFPLEIAYRLINMYSTKNDIVLDPFVGTGTTTLAAMISGRNSIGFEIDKGLSSIIETNISDIVKFGNKCIEDRIRNHIEFINSRNKDGSVNGSLKESFKYYNKNYNFPVMTNQEINLKFDLLKDVKKTKDSEFEKEFEIEYEK